MSSYSIIEGAEVEIVSLYHATKTFVKRVELKIGGLALVLFLSLDAPYRQDMSVPKNQQVAIESIIQKVSESEMRVNKLQESLRRHQGDLLSASMVAEFIRMASEIKGLDFKDALVRYNAQAQHITCDLLMEDGFLVHLTQYFVEPTDQVVYSVERDANFIRSGYAPLEGFRSVIMREVDRARLLA